MIYRRPTIGNGTEYEEGGRGGKEERWLWLPFSPPPALCTSPPRRTAFPTAAVVSGQYTRTRRAPEQQARVEIHLRNRGRLPAVRIWRVRRCMVMVGVRGARMCDGHEGSVEDERGPSECRARIGGGRRVLTGYLRGVSTRFLCPLARASTA